MMNAQSLEDLVASYLDGCDVSVTEQGGHYTITAIGSRFEGLRPVKRQQAVYAAVA